MRLLDFGNPPMFDSPVYDYEINRQLDIWTRDTSILTINLLADIIDGVNPTILTPNPGYQIGQVLNIAIRQSGQTVLNLKVRTPAEMYEQFIDWPDTATDSSTPEYAIFDFDPNTNGRILHNAITLWPAPSQSWTANDSGGAGGLVVTCKAVTNNLLQNDDDALPLLARMALEPIVEKTCEALLARIGNDLAGYHGTEARLQSQRIRRSVGQERRKPRGSVSYHV